MGLPEPPGSGGAEMRLAKPALLSTRVPFDEVQSSDMMRITVKSPALIAVRTLLAGSMKRPKPRAARSGSRMRSRPVFQAEELESRILLDAGMAARLADLVDSSDTGSSNKDNLTYDTTPALAGGVRGAATQVQLFINGKPHGDPLPVADGTWTYTVAPEAALAKGKHAITVRPINASGAVGKLSKPLVVTVATTPPRAPTLGVGKLSPAATAQKGVTIVGAATFRGVVQPGRQVSVSIDGQFAGRVSSDARTGAWSFKSPGLANGVHTVSAVAEDRAGLRSAAASLTVWAEPLRTVTPDTSNGQPVDLMAAHVLGAESQGFIVTKVSGGTLQKWSASRNRWEAIPNKALATDPATLQNAPDRRIISFEDVVRLKPASGSGDSVATFDVVALRKPGAPRAAVPEAATVPGAIVDPVVSFIPGVAAIINWKTPIDGCGCKSLRYTVEATLNDGRTAVYNVTSDVNEVALTDGDVQSVEMWAATKRGAGPRSTLGVSAESSLAASSTPTEGAVTLEESLMVNNLKVNQTAPGVFSLAWTAPALPTLPGSVLAGWGVAPGIKVVSYSVTMKQDLINPYSNELQTGLPFDGSATQNGNNTAWLAGLSNATTSPTYPSGEKGPFNTGAYTIDGGLTVIPGQTTVLTAADVTSYTFDMSVGLDVNATLNVATSKKPGSVSEPAKISENTTITTVTPNPYARMVFEVTPIFSSMLPNNTTAGIPNVRYWSGVDSVEPYLSLFLAPTAMLGASDGSMWVAYQRTPLAKVIHRMISWMDPFSQGLATTFTGYISNKEGTGPGNYLTVTDCDSPKGKCKLPGGGLITSDSRQEITLESGTWGTPPTFTSNGAAVPYKLLVGARQKPQGTNQQYKLLNISRNQPVSVATGNAADWTTPVQLVATPTKLKGAWEDVLRTLGGTSAILSGNFKELKKIERTIAGLSPATKLAVLRAFSEPLPEDQVRQYTFVDGAWQLTASFITTMNGTNGTGGGSTGNAADGQETVVIPHSLVESADGQIFVASRGLAGGVKGDNRSGWARFSPALSKQVGYVQRIGGEKISFTGNIGVEDGRSASFTGGISDGQGAAGDVLNVSTVSSTSTIRLAPGQILTAGLGTTIAPGTQIERQLTALVNGTQVPVSQVFGIPFTGTIDGGTAGTSGSILTVSAVGGLTPLAVGLVIANAATSSSSKSSAGHPSGTVIPAGTVITAQLSGQPGGPGTYQLSGDPLLIASTAMTASFNTGSADSPVASTTAVLGGAGTYKLRAGSRQLVAESSQLNAYWPASVLKVTQMTAGSPPIVVGQTFSAPGVAEGSRIVSQLTYVNSSGTSVKVTKATPPSALGGVGTYMITGAPTVVASTPMSQLSAQTIDLSGTPTWGTFAAAPDGSVWIGINDLGNSVGSRKAKRVVKNGALQQIAPTGNGPSASWATQPVKYEFMHPPVGLAITPTSGTPPVKLVGSISGTTLTVTKIESGATNDANQFVAGTGLSTGQFISGVSVGPVTTIVKQLTYVGSAGTSVAVDSSTSASNLGGAGTYEVSSPVGGQTVGGPTGIAMTADTYAIWVNESEANGRDANPGISTIGGFFMGKNGQSAASGGAGFGVKSVLNTGGTVRLNNSQDFKLKSTIARIDSSMSASHLGNRQDVGRGAMGMIAVPGQDAVLAAVGTTSLLAEVGYGAGYWGCRVVADGEGGKACKAVGLGNQSVFGSLSKMWKRGSGKIVQVEYNPNAYQAENGGSRTSGLDFLKVTDTLHINTSWLGTSEFLMEDAGRPQSLAIGPDGSIYMGGRGSLGGERSAFLADINPTNFWGSGVSTGASALAIVSRIFVEFGLFIDELNIMINEDLKPGHQPNQSNFSPVRNAYNWKTKGSPAFVAKVWTPGDGLLDAPGDPILMGPIPRIQTFGQVYPFASPVTKNPKTGLPTGAPEGIFAQNAQFGGALFLPTTPGTPSGLSATPLVGGATGDSTTLTWQPPATPKRSPVISYTATAYAGDTAASVTTSGTSAPFAGLQANGGTTYYTVSGTNYFGTSSDANGQPAGGQLWLAADGKTVLSTAGLSVGMVSDGTPFTNGGADRNGHAYSWDAIPGSDSATLSWNGVSFGLGSAASLAVNGLGGQQPNQPNLVHSQGQTIKLSQTQINFQIDTTNKGLDQAVNVLNLAGAAVNGGKAGQTIRLNYTDGTSEIWTQSFSDWCTPNYNPNEGIVSVQSYRNTATGGKDQTTNYIYGYSRPIAQGKTLASVTLPANPDVMLLGLEMSTSIAVSLGQNVSNSPLNTFGITTPPWQVANHQGFDGNGNYFDAYDLNDTTPPGGDVISRGNAPPKEIVMSWAGSAFQVGQIPTSNSQVGGRQGPRNVAQAKGQTIYMPSGTYTNLQLIGAGFNGTQSNQNITVNFTDGTTATWTQTFSDWASAPIPAPASGEAVMNGGTQINQLGNPVNRPANVYGYSYAIPSGKTVQSLTLPKAGSFGILGISLVGTPSVAPWSGVGIVTDGTKFSSTGGFDGDGNAYSWNLLTGQPTPASSNFVATINNGLAPAAFTGSINSGKTATFLGGIGSGTDGTAGTALAVFDVAAGSASLAAGQLISGAGVAAGTVITGQLTYGPQGQIVTSGTPASLLGGVGVYSVNVSQSVAAGTMLEASQPGNTLTIDGPISGAAQLAQLGSPGASSPTNPPVLTGPGIAPGTTITKNVSTTSTLTGTINNGTAGSPGTTLMVTAISGTPLSVGQVITGAGIAPGTTIAAQISTPANGQAGGAGIYSLSGPPQSIGLTTMTATQYRYTVSGPAQWSAPSTAMTATSPGNTLTVSSVTGGTITVGQTIGGSNFYTQTTASYTGSINNGQIANFVGSISNGTPGAAGNVLSVSSVSGTTPIAVGQIIAGTGVAAGTTITAFVSGTNGGVGTYTVSGSPQAVAASTPLAAAQPGTTLTVTSIAAPVGSALGIGQAVTGPGVAPGTTITAVGVGSGGVGTYTISGPPQWVAPATALTTTQPGAPLVADDTTITAFVSGTNGGPGVYTVSGPPQAVASAPMAGNTREPVSTLITAAPWNGVGFEIGGPNKPNVLRGEGQTVYGSYTQTADQAAAGTQQLNLAQAIVDECAGGGCVISLAAAAANGNQNNQTLVVNYTGGTADSITQNYSNWWMPVYISSTSSGGAIGPASFKYSSYAVNSTTPVIGMMSYPGEWIIASQSSLNNSSGAADSTTIYLYGYSYWIPVGSTPQSITLPADQNVGVLSIAATRPTMVDLSSVYNAFGITTAPWQVANHQGFDDKGQYYNASNLDLGWAKGKGSVDSTIYMTWAGVAFELQNMVTEASQVGGKDGPSNVVQAAGQTIDITAGDYANLFMIGASNDGSQTANITVNFTDGTSATWTQTFSDWEVTPTTFPTGEVLVNAGTQILQDGNQSGNTANVYGYSYAIPDGKTVKSVQLPNNKAVGILGISLL